MMGLLQALTELPEAKAKIKWKKNLPVVVAVLQKDQIGIFTDHGIKALGSGPGGCTADSVVDDLDIGILLLEPI